MKNLLTITLLSLLLLFSCQKEKSKEEQKVPEEITSTFDSTALATTSIDKSENQTFFLRYKFIPGESFKYRMTTISDQEQSITADSSRTDKLTQTIIFIMDFKVLSLDADSVAELECTFSSVNLKAKANGIDINYQSGAQMDSTQRMKFPEYESFKNNPFNIRVGKHGEIIDIYKFDKITNRFLEMRGLADSLTAQQKVIAQQDMTNRSIKPLLAQIFREVPEHKMAKDSTWSYKRESMPIVVFQVDYENQYKVEKLELLGNEKLAVINGTIKTKVSGKQAYSERGINYQFEKPVTTASGKIYFNMDKGLIQKSRSQTKLVNSYTMEMPSPQGVKKAKAKEVSSNVNIVELL
jgi:hypothetical protein